jgi:hypothetical protein
MRPKMFLYLKYYDDLSIICVSDKDYIVIYSKKYIVKKTMMGKSIYSGFLREPAFGARPVSTYMESSPGVAS